MSSKITSKSATNQQETTGPIGHTLRTRRASSEDGSRNDGRESAKRRRTAEPGKKKLPVVSEPPKPDTPRRAHTPPLVDTSVERPRNVDKVIYGNYEIGAWYYSPYPTEFGQRIERLYVCERCLKYMSREEQLQAHKIHCTQREPPGKLIYADKGTKVYEVDGRLQKLYCQNLCLIAKLFLDHKTLYYDVEGFTFFVLTVQESRNRRLDQMVGYFSKEKISYDNYNLACIMTLPTHQRKGYGRLLIELSYELSRREGVIGSPEKPLSSLGLLGYESFWASAVMLALRGFQGLITVEELCKETCVHEDDVISTLNRLGLLQYRKPAAGGNESPAIQPLEVGVTHSMIEKAIKTYNVKMIRQLNPKCMYPK